MAEQQDLRAAKQTYEGFIGLFKYGTIACIAVVALVVILIS